LKGPYPAQRSAIVVVESQTIPDPDELHIPVHIINFIPFNRLVVILLELAVGTL
jgi:hypothetical protein